MKVNPEGKVVTIGDRFEVISTGWTNITPWRAPRECEEEVLAEKIEAMASNVKNMRYCIFNFHCPPHDSGIDQAPKLDETLRPVLRGAYMETIPAGSTAVRNAIEKHQPMLGLHGHIHESPGHTKIGRTLCLNPGSEYSQGILKGVIVNLDDGGVRSHFMVRG